MPGKAPSGGVSMTPQAYLRKQRKERKKKKEGEIPGNLLLTESYLIDLMLKSLSLKAVGFTKLSGDSVLLKH